MNNILEYKGYFTKIEYSSEDKILFGKIEGIVDLVTFESESINEIEDEFHSAVDDYLAFCKETNKEPDKVYRGVFNVRITPELHKAISLLAFRNNESLNQTVEKAIDSYVNGNSRNNLILHETIQKLTTLTWNTMQQTQIKQAIPSFNIYYDPKLNYKVSQC